MQDDLFHLFSALSRLDRAGAVGREQLLERLYPASEMLAGAAVGNIPASREALHLHGVGFYIRVLVNGLGDSLKGIV